MVNYLTILMVVTVAAAEPLATDFVQLAPAPNPALLNMWTRQHPRAVVLIPGLRLFDVAKPTLHSWQHTDGHLVKELAKDSDVFAFAYSQTVPVDDVAVAPDLRRYIERLKFLGYTQIVLVGHSAGGIIARQFIEDNPTLPITKCVQICTPNGGASWAKATIAARKNQEPFFISLTKETRQQHLQERAGRRIPPQVEFACVVATVGSNGDGVVANSSQWPEDLRSQGIPAVAITAAHRMIVHTHHHAELIARIVKESQPRWSQEQVREEAKKILGAGEEKKSAARGDAKP